MTNCLRKSRAAFFLGKVSPQIKLKRIKNSQVLRSRISQAASIRLCLKFKFVSDGKVGDRAARKVITILKIVLLDLEEESSVDTCK